MLVRPIMDAEGCMPPNNRSEVRLIVWHMAFQDASALLRRRIRNYRGQGHRCHLKTAIAAITEVKWKKLTKLLSSNGIDALVLDNYEFYGEVVPMHLGMPYAILSNALHFDYSGAYTPLHP